MSSLLPLVPKVSRNCQGTSVEDHAPAAHQACDPSSLDSLMVSYQGQYKRWTELGRGHGFFREILEVLCCFVLEMFLFLWGTGRSAFLFQLTCRVTSRVILEHVTWKYIQKIPEYPRWGRLHNLSGKSVPVHSKEEVWRMQQRLMTMQISALSCCKRVRPNICRVYLAEIAFLNKKGTFIELFRQSVF